MEDNKRARCERVNGEYNPKKLSVTAYCKDNCVKAPITRSPVFFAKFIELSGMKSIWWPVRLAELRLLHVLVRFNDI